MAILILDADRSLSSIGSTDVIKKTFGITPVVVSDGLDQVKEIFRKLFSAKRIVTKHEIFGDQEEIVFEMAEKAKSLDVKCVAIDTLSHVFRQDLKKLETVKDSNKTRQMEQRDWGTLDRLYRNFLESMKQLPIPVVINSHQRTKDDGDGVQIKDANLKGGPKDLIREYFDVVVFTQTQKGKKVYLWQTFADPVTPAKTRLDILEPIMPQDLSIIINKYREHGHNAPKILVIGESGTGKTKALETLTKI